ncbi:MAG: P-loop NTPase [Pseudomonadota bacterium]
MSTQSKEIGIQFQRTPESIRVSCGMPKHREQALPTSNVHPAKSQVICVAGGKGGTGKTIIAANLAVMLARRGHRVTLLDADFGLANAHLVLGIEPKRDISDVLSGELSMGQIIEQGPLGLKLVSGGLGRSKLAMLHESKLDFLVGELACLEESSDIIVVDLAAGMSAVVARFLSLAHDIILVSNHEVTARADVISTIGMLADTLGAATIHLVINMARNRNHAVVTFQQIWSRVNSMWRGRIKLFFSGWIPKSHYVTSSLMRGKPLVLVHPQSQPSRCLDIIAERMHKHHMTWRSRQKGRWGVPSAFASLAGTD